MKKTILLIALSALIILKAQASNNTICPPLQTLQQQQFASFRYEPADNFPYSVEYANANFVNPNSGKEWNLQGEIFIYETPPISATTAKYDIDSFLQSGYFTLATNNTGPSCTYVGQGPFAPSSGLRYLLYATPN